VVKVETQTDIIERAVQIAKSVVSHSCPGVDLKVAPIEIDADMDVLKLLQVSSPFVLMEEVASVAERLLQVYVPMALAKHLAQKGDATFMPGMDDITALPEFDMHIQIAKGNSFVIGDSDCSFQRQHPGHYSLITTMIHEMLHGMGIYSVISEERGGGLGGSASIYDALITKDMTRYLYESSEDVQVVTGKQLEGQKLRLGFDGPMLYNPSPFNPGTSISHFDTSPSVMQHAVDDATCNFVLGAQDIHALQKLGWDCILQSDPLHWDTEEKTLLADYLSTVQDTGDKEVHHTSSHSHHDTWCGHHECYELGIWGPVSIFLFLMVLLWCLYCYCIPAYVIDCTPPTQCQQLANPCMHAQDTQTLHLLANKECRIMGYKQ
jgi:hypothetical protein